MVTDVILQAVSQIAAHRLALYASLPHLQAFPSRKFCDDAQELGLGTSEYRGPCLVLLRNCAVTPKEFVDHVMGCFLRGYIVRIYWCNQSSECKSSFMCQLKKTITSLNLEGLDSNCDRTIVAARKDVLEHANNASFTDGDNGVVICSKATFRLQTFPRELSGWVINELPEFDYAMHGFTYSVYAVECNGVIRFGIGKGEDMYLTACDREALFKGYVARACSKLEEALHVKGIKLTKDMLGAAPGAWTEFLSKRVNHVVAIDPGQLDKNILGEQVTHICKKAQDSFQDLHGRKFDLLVCDMNKHPVEAAEIVRPLLQFLNTGGFLIMTLKFHGRGKDKVEKVSEIKGMFDKELEKMEHIWLLANSIYERTFIGIKKAL